MGCLGTYHHGNWYVFTILSCSAHFTIGLTLKTSKRGLYIGQKNVIKRKMKALGIIKVRHQADI